MSWGVDQPLHDDEDSKFGLKVRKRTGTMKWHAYGDKRYFDSNDAANRVRSNAGAGLGR